MKRALGLILLGVGTALIVIAPLSKWYIAPAVAVAPLNVYQESRGAGVVIKQLDEPKFTAGVVDPYYPPSLPVTSNRYTAGDVLAAEQDPAQSQGLAIWNSFSRVNTADGRLVTQQLSRYAFDRTTSQLSTCCGAAENRKGAAFSGVMPLKFPFFTQQQTYDVWDPVLQAAKPAIFQGSEDHAGVKAYKFLQTIAPAKVPGSETPVPARLVGLPGADNVTISRFYTNSTIIWVEPLTGQVVDSTTSPLVTMRGPEGTSDLLTYLSMQLQGEPGWVAENASRIKSDAMRLSVFTLYLPVSGVIAGVIFILIAIVLLRLSRKRNVASESAAGYIPPPPPPIT